MYYVLMLLCLIILGKAFFSGQWGKGILIIILWGTLGAALLTLGVVGYFLLIIMNILLLVWLNKN